MQAWKTILVTVLSIALLVALLVFLWALFVLLTINFMLLNLDTKFTNKPVRLAFTGAQAEAWDKAREREESEREGYSTCNASTRTSPTTVDHNGVRVERRRGRESTHC
jgi:hypothetical protein